MDAATLRRLLIDRDGGALSEDVMALLDAHVEQNAAACSAADEHTATMADARTVLLPQSPVGVPAFPRQAIEAALRQAPAASHRPISAFKTRNRLTGLAAAACVVLAFLAGRQSQSPTPMAFGPVTTVALEQPARRTNGGMWSLNAARLPARSDTGPTEPSLKWTTPLEWSVTRKS